jgi:RecA-family ATPase
MRVIKGGKSLNDMADQSSPLDVLADGLLGERNLGDIAMPAPRAWLLGNTFCRGFHSSLLGLGGVGKTAVRYAQLMACASGRPITGEHVFQRSRVLILCFEDGVEELERRLLAVMIYHHIEPEDMRDWLFYACPTRRVGKLARIDQTGNVEAGDLVQAIEGAVQFRQIDILAIDPFIKAHGVEENDNSQMDAVMEILAELAIRNDIATDASAHVRKGNDIAGNAEAGRGASAQKDAAGWSTRSPLWPRKRPRRSA